MARQSFQNLHCYLVVSMRTSYILTLFHINSTVPHLSARQILTYTFLHEMARRSFQNLICYLVVSMCTSTTFKVYEFTFNDIKKLNIRTVTNNFLPLASRLIPLCRATCLAPLSPFCTLIRKIKSASITRNANNLGKREKRTHSLFGGLLRLPPVAFVASRIRLGFQLIIARTVVGMTFAY